jgi:hypothetical protein
MAKIMANTRGSDLGHTTALAVPKATGIADYPYIKFWLAMSQKL